MLFVICVIKAADSQNLSEKFYEKESNEKISDIDSKNESFLIRNFISERDFDKRNNNFVFRNSNLNDDIISFNNLNVEPISNFQIKHHEEKLNENLQSFMKKYNINLKDVKIGNENKNQMIEGEMIIKKNYNIDDYKNNEKFANQMNTEIENKYENKTQEIFKNEIFDKLGEFKNKIFDDEIDKNRKNNTMINPSNPLGSKNTYYNKLPKKLNKKLDNNDIKGEFNENKKLNKIKTLIKKNSEISMKNDEKPELNLNNEETKRIIKNFSLENIPKRKETSDFMINKYFVAKINIQRFTKDKRENYFENLKCKVNISPDNLNIIFDENNDDSNEVLNKSIKDFSKNFEEDSKKYSFSYRSLEKCEQFLFNKDSFENFKAKDLNSFNNMFLNNEDHEDNHDSSDNPNYDEKNFENEYCDLEIYNFYLKFNFRFEKISSKRISEFINFSQINKDEKIINGDIKNNKEKGNFDEKKDDHENKENKKDHDEEKGMIEDKEFLEITVKINFNHKNLNGKSFLDFFKSFTSGKPERINLGVNSMANNSTSFFQNEIKEEYFSLENLKNQYIDKLINDFKKNAENKDDEFIIKKAPRRQISEDPLDKDEYYIKNIEAKYEESTIKEKKLFFLKYLNSIIFDSCLYSKAHAENLKLKMKRLFQEKYFIKNNITSLQNNLGLLYKKKDSLNALYNDSVILQNQKYVIKNIEFNQINYYKNIIERIEKSTIRDFILMKKELNKLKEKEKELEELRNLFNKSQEIELIKKNSKKTLEFDIESSKNLLIKSQAELIDNENIINMIISDKTILETKISFKEKKISQLRNSKNFLEKKIKITKEDKNKTTLLIQINDEKKRDLMIKIQKDNKEIDDIEKQIQRLIEKKNILTVNVNNYNEKIELIENDNLSLGNKLNLIEADLNYLERNFEEKSKKVENLFKNLNQTQNEFQKLKHKFSIFYTHAKIINNTIEKISTNLKNYNMINESLEKDILKLSDQLIQYNQQILNKIDEINYHQMNINKYNLNNKNNQITKKNFQINIKNTINALKKKKILDNGEKFYEYVDLINLSNISDKSNIKKFSLNHYLEKKRLKLIQFLKSEKIMNDDIQFIMSEKINIKNMNQSFKNQNLTDIYQIGKYENMDRDGELDENYNSSKKNLLSNFLDDYIIIDFDKIKKRIDEYNDQESNLMQFNNNNFRNNLKEYNTELKNVNGNEFIGDKDYINDIELLDKTIEKNKNDVENFKSRINSLKKQFFEIYSTLKDKIFSNFKILLDLIELDYKDNNLNKDLKRINKIIDILK